MRKRGASKTQGLVIDEEMSQRAWKKWKIRRKDGGEAERKLEKKMKGKEMRGRAQ